MQNPHLNMATSTMIVPVDQVFFLSRSSTKHPPATQTIKYSLFEILVKNFLILLTAKREHFAL